MLFTESARECRNSVFFWLPLNAVTTTGTPSVVPEPGRSTVTHAEVPVVTLGTRRGPGRLLTIEPLPQSVLA